MVKNQQLSEFSPAQNMALAMLGYYRWLPREIIASRAEIPHPKSFSSPPESLSPQKPTPITPEINSLPVIEQPPITEKPWLITLVGQKARVNIARDYVILSAKNLPCLFLLPPLWANGENLQCFATPLEKQLWLNAWQAIDIPVVKEVFAAFFEQKIPIQIVPNLPLSQTLAQEKTHLPIICVGLLHGLVLPPDRTYFSLSHPWFLLQKPPTKKTFWIELLTLKEKLF